MGRLSGKVAIVTGAGGRLGSASALAMAEHGAEVLVVDVNGETAKATSDLIKSRGGRAEPHVTDVSDESAVKDMINAAVKHFGGLDALFNNAGLIGREWGVGLLDLSVELWDEVQRVNLRSVFLCCKHAVPVMIERGGGSIINQSSGSSLYGDQENFSYATSKAGVNLLTQYVAASFGKQSIRCNAISPGICLRQEDWDRLQDPRSKAHFDVYKVCLDHIMMPRFGTPEDIANAAVFLASDELSFISGQLLPVDGGFCKVAPQLAGMRRLRAEQAGGA